jgi:hypothetical protein
MKNEFEVRGDVTAIIINSPKYGRIETLISTKQLERANEFPKSWYVTFQKQTGTFYVKGDIYINPKKNEKVFLHRWIKRAENPYLVDHINNNTLDNTDENLRIVTIAENAQNRKGAQSNNKSSGVRGVTWNARSGKWQASVKLNQHKIHIGVYADIEDAESAVKEARRKHMPYSQEALAK